MTTQRIIGINIIDSVNPNVFSLICPPVGVKIQNDSKKATLYRYPGIQQSAYKFTDGMCVQLPYDWLDNGNTCKKPEHDIRGVSRTDHTKFKMLLGDDGCKSHTSICDTHLSDGRFETCWIDKNIGNVQNGIGSLKGNQSDKDWCATGSKDDDNRNWDHSTGFLLSKTNYPNFDTCNNILKQIVTKYINDSNTQGDTSILVSPQKIGNRLLYTIPLNTELPEIKEIVSKPWEHTRYPLNDRSSVICDVTAGSGTNIFYFSSSGEGIINYSNVENKNKVPINCFDSIVQDDITADIYEPDSFTFAEQTPNLYILINVTESGWSFEEITILLKLTKKMELKCCADALENDRYCPPKTTGVNRHDYCGTLLNQVCNDPKMIEDPICGCTSQYVKHKLAQPKFDELRKVLDEYDVNYEGMPMCFGDCIQGKAYIPPNTAPCSLNLQVCTAIINSDTGDSTIQQNCKAIIDGGGKPVGPNGNGNGTNGDNGNGTNGNGTNGNGVKPDSGKDLFIILGATFGGLIFLLFLILIFWWIAKK